MEGLFGVGGGGGGFVWKKKGEIVWKMWRVCLGKEGFVFWSCSFLGFCVSGLFMLGFCVSGSFMLGGLFLCGDRG